MTNIPNETQFIELRKSDDGIYSVCVNGKEDKFSFTTNEGAARRYFKRIVEIVTDAKVHHDYKVIDSYDSRLPTDSAE